MAVDFRPVVGGEVELYCEVFPDGTPVDDSQRVRLRPRERPPSSPAWTVHRGAPRPCEPLHACHRTEPAA